jgi:hypothetical protein
MSDGLTLKTVEDWDGLSEWMAEYISTDFVSEDLNMAEMARVMSTSTRSIKAWLSQPDCPMPFVEQGTNGREYVLRLSWCLAWQKHQDAKKKNKNVRLAQLQAQFAGLSLDDDKNSDVLTPKQVREVAEARIRHAEAGRMLGTLTEVDGVYRLLEEIFIIVRDSAMGACDRLERELSLTPAQTRRAERVMEEMLTAMGDTVNQTVIGKDFEPNLEMNKQLVNRT